MSGEPPGVTIVDELELGFGWHERGGTRRTGHAVGAAGRVWLLDPFDAPGLDHRIAALGEPAGVIQLLDRHNRDTAAFAQRLGVPLHVVPTVIPGSPFRILPVARRRFWAEIALWWPEERLLACGDALGTVPFFLAGDERVGVHPLLRLAPPRALAGLAARHLLVGHGAGRHGAGTGEAVDSALRNARRGLPRLLLGLPRILGGGRR